MKKTTDEELNKGQSNQESAETAADNNGIDKADTSQTDNLRAYVPAGAAMALAPSLEEEPYYKEDYPEEDEDEYDDDDSAVNEIARDMDQESASELLFRYAEQDRLDQESEEGAAYEEELEGDPDTASTEEDLGEDHEDELDADEEEREDGSSEVEKGSGPASIGAAVLDMAKQDLIDETVQAIRSMYRKNVDNGKIEIGELLLDKAFDGKIDQAISTNPQKNDTFAKIAKRLDRLVEPKTLGSWVRAAAAMRGLKKHVGNLPNLTTYHYVELATVRDEKERIKFAKDAELKGWSVKALREEIRKSKSTDKSEAEQLKAEMDANIRRFSDFATDSDLTDFASDIDSVKQAYPPEKAMKLLPEVKQCLTSVRASEKLLKEFHGSLRSIVEEAMEPLSD